MIGGAERPTWKDLDRALRPFVRRRVRTDADADDVLQDIYLRIQRGVASLKDDERFGPWVYRLARNAVADHHRAQARDPLARSVSIDSTDAFGETQPGLPADATAVAAPEPDADQELARYLAPFVAMLPSPYREALTLTELEGLTQREAAEMIGVSLSGMKSRVQRGREKLRQALEDCCTIALDSRGKVIAFSPRPDGKLPGMCCG